MLKCFLSLQSDFDFEEDEMWLHASVVTLLKKNLCM